MDSIRQGNGNNELHPESLRKHRKEKKENQLRFWSRFGVTQSRGSRFEMGAEIPPPVAILLKLYLDGTVTDSDFSRIRRQCRRGRSSALNIDAITLG